MAFADALDLLYAIKCDLQMLTNEETELSMITDCLSLFVVYTNAKMTFKKRLMTDLISVKELSQKWS